MYACVLECVIVCVLGVCVLGPGPEVCVAEWAETAHTARFFGGVMIVLFIVLSRIKHRIPLGGYVTII